MNFKSMYAEKLISIPEAVGMLRSRQRVVTAMCASEPVGLLSELEHHAGRLEDVHIFMCLPMRHYGFYTKLEMAGHFFLENWFYGVPDRKAHPLGMVSYVPNNLHRAGSDRIHAGGLNVFWGTATPPNDRGIMSLSTSLVFERQLLDAADVVVLEINPNLPWTLGDTQISLRDVDYIVEHEAPLVTLASIEPADVEATIGHYIADLIEDGATLQLGIGGIPNAIAHSLYEKHDLGVHTEMFTDGMVDLFEAGVITGRRKTLWPNKLVGAFALGTQKLYDFIHNNVAVEFQQGKVTNDPYVLGRNTKMVSINTALQVDVLGQVCSQSIGSRHFSGTGGQLDTHRGAQMSPGGRGIIALRSTAKDGTVSTIVPQLSAGAEVTVPSQDVDTVVTEFGVAELRGLCLRDRSAALIGIAHPDFRPWLREEVKRLGI
ncbi:MAG: acetyl-CoA hydrolase/transferase family protein [Anaerolineae bacterium]|nr:acetyl-CoA hydrolase/transferase family protein [Anaerolineae bacterium]